MDLRALETCGIIRSTLCLFFVLALNAAHPLVAETPSIENVEFPAIERGNSAQLKVVGANLASARELVFYEPGLRCETIEVKSGEELVVQLTAAADCPLGMHGFRIRGDGGFSELRTLAVTPHPVVQVTDGSSGPLALKLNNSAVGRLNAESSTTFSVELAQDQRLSLDVEAIRLGIDMIDTAVIVRGPDGQLILQADDSNLYRQDPIASFVAKESGRYTLEIVDAGRNAGEYASYVLHVSSGPRPTAVFPLGGQPGSSLNLTYSGDCRGTWTVQQLLPELDPRAPNSFQLLANQDGMTSSTPVPFRLSPLPNVIESPNNDALSGLNPKEKSETPVALNGRIEQPLDRDCFWLGGIAGEKLEAQVFAQRLGSTADTLLSVVNSSQQVLAQSDDVDSLDSRVEFVVPPDNLFGIIIEEKRNKGGDDCTYRVEVTTVSPTAEVFLPRRDRLSQVMQAVSVPVGNRVLALMAVRKDDANGQANVRFPQLPGGIVAHFLQPQVDQAVIPVVFEAAQDMNLSGQLIPVEVSVHGPTGTAVGPFHQVTDLVGGPADAIYTEHHADRLALCSREPYPIRITLVQPQSALCQDGTLGLIAKVERQPGFTGAVNLTIPWLPAWVDAEPRISIPADQTQAIIQLRSWKQAATATWPLVIEASVDNTSTRRGSRGNSSPNDSPATLYPQSIASNLVELRIKAAPAVAQFQAAAAELGQTVTVHCELTAEDELRELSNLTATLEGLPNRVETKAVDIQPKSQVISFQVQVSQTAPVGRYAGLACRLSGLRGGESVSYVVARDGQLTIDQPGQILRDEQGRPLNRIEALRKKLRTQ